MALNAKLVTVLILSVFCAAGTVAVMDMDDDQSVDAAAAGNSNTSTATVGVSWSKSIIGGFPPNSVSGMPSWMSSSISGSGHNMTLTFSGTPTQTGTYVISFGEMLDTLRTSTLTVTVSAPAVKSYNVAYLANGASGVMVGHNGITEGSYVTLKTCAFDRVGYTFTGWKVNNAGSTLMAGSSYCVTSNASLYAQWSANVYQVTFNSNGGSDIASASVYYNDTVTYPTEPTKSNYTFGGWYLDSALTDSFSFATHITGNTTLYAKWILNTYSVTFDVNGGSSCPSMVIGAGQSFDLPTSPIKANFSFGGWFTDSAHTSPYVRGTTVTANLTLYAKWYADLTVTFDVDGGTAIGFQKIAYNGLVTVPDDPSKDGFVFIGWYADDAKDTPFGFGSIITADRTIYAKFVSDTDYEGFYPHAILSVTPDSENGLKISVSSGSTGATSLRWDFGDGAFSDKSESTYTYAHAGVYVITLTVVNDAGYQDIKTFTYNATSPEPDPEPDPDKDKDDASMITYGIIAAVIVAVLAGAVVYFRRH